MKKSAGVIIILNNNKILLSHATNARWEKTFSFPKGGIEKDEKKKDAAIRELAEETSIVITKEQISNPDDAIIVNYIDKSGVNYKRLYLYTVYIEDISEIGLESEIVPIENLQADELDWCGFLTKEEAKDKIFNRVEHLLDLIN
jgi:8-oxo-dGTP pyrophosphatase MutT (NUDIX family)